MKAVLRSSSIISRNISNNLKSKTKSKANKEFGHHYEGNHSEEDEKRQSPKYEEEKLAEDKLHSEEFERTANQFLTKIYPTTESNKVKNPVERKEEKDGQSESFGDTIQYLDMQENQRVNSISDPTNDCDLPKIVERLILFSLGDTFATEEIFDALKSKSFE